MFLLDTNVISELCRAGDAKVDGNVIPWLASENAASFFISAVTIMELELGIPRVERRDVGQGARLCIWMDNHVLPEFSERTLPVDAVVALRCARLHVFDPRAEREAYIAATALVHGMTIVTRNVVDFEPAGFKPENDKRSTVVFRFNGQTRLHRKPKEA